MSAVLMTEEGQRLLVRVKLFEAEAEARGRVAATIAEQEYLLSGPGVAEYREAFAAVFGSEMADENERSSRALLKVAREKQDLDLEMGGTRNGR